MADRHFGIGCDQILLVQPSNNQQADFLFRVFNQDGGEVEQCGNGARCMGRYLADRGLVTGNRIRLATSREVMTLTLNEDDSLTVELGVPVFEPPAIPFLAVEVALSYDLELEEDSVTIAALAIGNPHAVQQVEDVDAAPVLRQGAQIESHRRFPARVNAGFMQIVDRGHVRLRVFERGVGETLGCGSGACAAAVSGMAAGQLDPAVTVSLPGGEVTVAWQGPGQPVYLRGSAHTVFSGSIDV